MICEQSLHFIYDSSFGDWCNCFPLYNDPAFVLRGDHALKKPPKPEPSARNACYKAGLGL